VSEPLPLSALEQVDAACDHFDATRKEALAGGPRLEDHLGAAAGPERTELLRQLVEDSRTDRPDRALTRPAV
jgi:hypothetical protein